MIRQGQLCDPSLMNNEVVLICNFALYQSVYTGIIGDLQHCPISVSTNVLQGLLSLSQSLS